MLTREKLGFKSGSQDEVYLIGYDLPELQQMYKTHDPNKPYDELQSYALEIENEAKRLKLPVQQIVKVLLIRADILIAIQCIMDALEVLDEAKSILVNLSEFNLKVQILAKQAVVYARLEQWSDVVAVCHEGINIVEKYRYSVNAPYLQNSYLGARIDLYTLGVHASYQLGDYEQMLEWAELSKCRWSLRSQQQSSVTSEDCQQTIQELNSISDRILELRSRNTPVASEQISELLVKRRVLFDQLTIQRMQANNQSSMSPFSLSLLQGNLDDDEIIFYYYWLNVHTLLVVVIDSEHCLAELHPVESLQYSCLKEYSEFVLSLSNPNTQNFNDVDKVQTFTKLLISEQQQHYLGNKRHLFISPHRLLHTIPFHALRIHERYLIEQAAITYVPNLSSLLLSYSLVRPQRVVAIGISNYDIPGHKLAPLKESEQEIYEIDHIYREYAISVLTLKGDDAKGMNVRHLAKEGTFHNVSCLHIATHGQNLVQDTPLESYLFLQDSILEGIEIAQWQLHSELVILSACSAGQRSVHGRGMNEFPGDELFGLQAAFFTAGAKQVLGALWPVHSEISKMMVLSFHQNLTQCNFNGRNRVAFAWQRTCVDYITNQRLGLRKILFWAPFFLFAIGRLEQ